jgi:hypothetical protein
VAFVPFFTFCQVARVIEDDRLWRLFFAHLPSADVSGIKADHGNTHRGRSPFYRF